jgi:hypothetical protein
MDVRYVMREARKLAKQWQVTVSLHNGVNNERGVRITGCDINYAREFCQALADKLYPHGAPVVSAGFACVWIV